MAVSESELSFIKIKAHVRLLPLKIFPALTILEINIIQTRSKRFSEPVEKLDPTVPYGGRVNLLFVTGVLTLKPKEGSLASKYVTAHRRLILEESH